MAMELLFENHTQLDEDVIQHIIKKNYRYFANKITPEQRLW